MSDVPRPAPLVTKSASETEMPSLLAGIVQDIKLLMVQHIQQARQELVANWKPRRLMVALSIVATSCASLGFALFGIGLAHLLHWLTSPGSSPSSGWPLYACYGAVAAGLTIISAVVFGIARTVSYSVPAWRNFSNGDQGGKH